ncbi:MAG: rhodanese-like domain-containing protein [Candidatus Xenobia bacterium]
MATRVSPHEAWELMQKEGYVYLDVRSVSEFADGHPEGAWNIPLLHVTSRGRVPNERFLDAVAATFPRTQKIVLGCASGGRSLHALQMLQQAGFSAVIDQRCGFEGNHAEPGWRSSGLPTAKAAPERDWAAIEARITEAR